MRDPNPSGHNVPNSPEVEMKKRELEKMCEQLCEKILAQGSFIVVSSFPDDGSIKGATVNGFNVLRHRMVQLENRNLVRERIYSVLKKHSGIRSENFSNTGIEQMMEDQGINQVMIIENFLQTPASEFIENGPLNEGVVK
jgi:hypothetical protein